MFNPQPHFFDVPPILLPDEQLAVKITTNNIKIIRLFSFSITNKYYNLIILLFESANELNPCTILINRKDISTILVAPLDWGLGHTTRCIPIIKELLNLNFKVIIACNGLQETIIKQEFPSIPTVFLPGYDIRYSISKVSTTLIIISQTRKILTAINRENHLLRQIILENSVDLVISDNRYGLFHGSVPTVFISHQISLHTGLGAFANRFATRRLAAYINKFSELWIPDIEGPRGLAGRLSLINKYITVRHRYMGPLSRFKPCTRATEKHVLAILSGPEPQRSLFERRILKSAEKFSGALVMVRGTNLPLDQRVPSGVVVYDIADSKMLNQLLCEASIVISRSGYTSLMDIIKLKKKWIAVATPGQAEQEYLASYINANGWGLSMQQSSFDINVAIELMNRFTFPAIEVDNERYKQVIHDFVER